MTTALEFAADAASRIDPSAAARNCGFGYEGSPTEGAFAAFFLNRPVRLAFPSFDGRFPGSEEEVPEDIRALLAYHLATSDGTEPAGKWISFADLPDGRFYCGTWRGYTGRALAGKYGSDVGSVRAAAESLGAEPVDLPGDVAVRLRVFPRVPVAFVYWAGDDEFEARADFLFDAEAGSHCSTDCYAVLCAILTRLLARGAS